VARRRPVLIALALAAATALQAVAGAPGSQARLVFAGDIMLSRQVARAVRGGADPWVNLREYLAGANLVVGNLEGAVGSESECTCKEPSWHCFAVDPGHLGLLAAAGFTAVGVENNHSGDLGADGREATAAAAIVHGLTPVSLAASPVFVRAGELTVALIALSLVPGNDGGAAALPSPELAQRLRLARAAADLAVVLVHWGDELVEVPGPGQRVAASWLVAHGANLVVGAHPHLVQQPECDGRGLVAYSLGNHVFDQRYPETRDGLLLDCAASRRAVTCTGVATTSRPYTLSPSIADGDRKVCTVELTGPLVTRGVRLRASSASDGTRRLEGWRAGTRAWSARMDSVVSLQRLALENGEELLLALERHHSPIDGKTSLRPYVYQVTDHGLAARWRGSALAWPASDVVTLPGRPGVICASHPGGSYLLPAERGAPPVAAYRWKGFGFRLLDEAAVVDTCVAALR
jgi:poly-gamma-glutamate capsule biosynthesis protein CapA/YwtB (metallophosphatase superfamily)